jgi:hypothetical protein
MTSTIKGGLSLEKIWTWWPMKKLLAMEQETEATPHHDCENSVARINVITKAARDQHHHKIRGSRYCSSCKYPQTGRSRNTLVPGKP